MLPFKLHGVHVVTLSGWISKVIVAGSQIVLMRLMLNVLGVEGYSSYVVIFSLYSWFSLMDFGIGYSYQNHISRCRVEGILGGDEGRFFTLSMIVLAGNLFVLPISITTVSILLYGHFSWKVMDICLVGMFCSIAHLSCVFMTVYKIFYAEHKGYISNILPALASLSTLCIMLVFAEFEFIKGNLFFAVFVTYLPICLAASGCFFWKVKTKFKFDYIWAVGIIRDGRKYLAFAFLSLLTLNVDLLIISRSLSSVDVVEYNLVLKVFSLVLYLYSAYLMAFMPVSAEMIRRGEFVSLKAKIKSGMYFGFVLALVSSVFVVIFKDSVASVLTSGIASIHFGLVVMFFFYLMIRMWTDTFSTLLQSVGFMSGMLVCVVVQASISIGTQLWLVGELGVYGVILGVIISFLLTVVWFLPLQYKKIESGVVRL